MHHDQLLGAAEGGLQTMGGVRGVGEDFAAAPAADGALADVVAFSQGGNAVVTGGDLSADGGREGIFVRR